MKTFKRKTTYNASNDRQTDRLWLTEIVKYVAKKKNKLKKKILNVDFFMVPSFSLERQSNNNNNITTTRKY